MSPRRTTPSTTRPGRARGRVVFAAVVLVFAALAFGVALVLELGFGRLVGSSRDDGLRTAVMAAVIVLIGAPLNAWIGPAVTRRVRDHLAADDRLECSFRVLQGEQQGLVTRWRPGVAALSPGRISFRHTVGGLRFLRRRPVVLEVTSIGSEPPRTLRGVEVLLVTPEAQAVRLVTPTAVLECAIVPSERIPWALERLQDH